MNLNKLDTIEINSKEELLELIAWRDKNKELVYQNYYDHPLNEGVIEFGNILIYFNKQDSLIEYKVSSLNKLMIGFAYNTDTKYAKGSLTEFGKEVLKFKDMSAEQIETGYKQDIIGVHFAIMTYMANAPERYIKTIRQVTNKKSKNKGRKKKVIKISRNIYKLSVPKDHNVSAERTYNRQINSWNVRGHWRTCKSGKRVWVKGHTKGKGEVEPKRYKL